MAVDRGYGSGKPRSAANSRARQRAAAGQMTKGKKGTSATLRKIAKKNPVTGFIGGGVSLGTLSKVGAGLSKAGKVSQSLSVFDRLYAKATGQELGKSIALARKEPMGSWNRNANQKGIENLKEFRLLSRDVFQKPAIPKGTGQTLALQARRKQLASGGTLVSRVRGTINPEGFAAMQKVRSPFQTSPKVSQEIARAATKAKRMTPGEKYRASLGGKVTRVAELEKRLNFPKRGR